MGSRAKNPFREKSGVLLYQKHPIIHNNHPPTACFAATRSSIEGDEAAGAAAIRSHLSLTYHMHGRYSTHDVWECRRVCKNMAWPPPPSFEHHPNPPFPFLTFRSRLLLLLVVVVGGGRKKSFLPFLVFSLSLSICETRGDLISSFPSHIFPSAPGRRRRPKEEEPSLLSVPISSTSLGEKANVRRNRHAPTLA